MADTEQLFSQLNTTEIRHRSEAERRLPSWLSQPTQFPAVNLVESAQNIEEFSEYLDADLIANIRKATSITKLFPVQKCLIPVLSRQFRSRAHRRPNDICVSSPTGSGKTLAFVIPIVNYLKQSLKRSLRALIVLPSRDLAQQVFNSFQEISRSTHLKCALATGEALERVFFRKYSHYDHNGSRKKFKYSHSINHNSGLRDEEYISTIDVLVSTPGMLIDLLDNSPGFSLRDLEILVIDEADRLMANHHHDWLNTVDRAITPQVYECLCQDKLPQNELSISSAAKLPLEKGRINFLKSNGCSIGNYCKAKVLHKLLFSATLSSDPQILMHMNLFQPRLFIATRSTLTGAKIRNSLGSANSTPCSSPLPNQFPTTVSTRNELLTTTAIPEELEEKMFITESKDKLYVMWYMLHELKYKKVVCFTNDKRRSYELFIFLNEIDGVRAVNFSSDAKPELRQKYINEFKKGQIEVIVATDLLSRGMDIDGIEYVISFDVPPSHTWYAHRVGRTARAGMKGIAITLVDTKQLVQFKKIVQLAHKLPNSMRLSDVVEEMKVASFSNRNPEKQDNYIKTFENYKDKLNVIQKKASMYKNKKLD